MDRWGQLAYTSARGGFGIHAEADLAATERDALVAGAYAGRGSFGQELPLLADPAQIATFHRNLAYRLVPGVGGCFWHSAPAGADESGRTGNCFVHALLGKDPSSTPGVPAPQLRPVEMWRSPSFRAPYGVQAVRAASLPPLPPSAGETVTRERAADFLSSFEVDRLSTFSRLVEATVERRRQPVILGVGSPDEGALWIAGLSYLLSPRAAWELSFSIWEAPELLTADRLPELEVICVQESAIPPTLDSLGLLVLRRTDPSPAVPGDGGDLPALFAQLAVHLFSLSPGTAVELLRQIDEVSAAVSDHDGHRMWPLAMVMAQHLERWPHLQDTITGVLLQVTPATMEQDIELWHLTERLIKERKARFGTDLEGMLDDVRHAAPGPLGTMLHQAYVETAALDPWWYAQAEHRRGSVDGTARLSGDMNSAWFQAAVAAVQGTDTPRAARTLTWLVDFLLAEGWPVQAGDKTHAGEDRGIAGHPLRDWWSEAPPAGPDVRQRPLASGPSVPVDSPFLDLIDVLKDPAASEEYLRSIGKVSADTRDSFIRPLVTWCLNDSDVRYARSPGERVSPALVDFLVPRAETSSDRAHPELHDALVVEALMQRLHGQDGSAVASTLARALRWNDAGADEAVVDDLLHRLRLHDLHSKDVVPLLAKFGDRVDPVLLYRTLAIAGVDELEKLASDIADALGTSLRGLARELVVLATDPVAYCCRPVGGWRDGGLNDTVDRGLENLRRLHTMQGSTGSEKEVLSLSAAWAPSFDFLVGVSDPTGWSERRRQLFGNDVPVQRSVEHIDQHLLRPGPAGSECRTTLIDRLLFSAWFADEWPEEVLGRRRSDRSSEQPWQRCAEIYLRSASEDEREACLEAIFGHLKRRDFGVVVLPAARIRNAERDVDAHERSAQEWLARAAGSGGWRRVGARLGIGRKKL